MSYDVKNLGDSIFELQFSKPISNKECKCLNYFFDNLPYHLKMATFSPLSEQRKYYDVESYSHNNTLLISDFNSILEHNKSITGYSEDIKFNNPSIFKIYPDFNLSQKFIYSLIYNNSPSFQTIFNNNSVIIHFDRSFENEYNVVRLINLINDMINPSPVNLFLNINPYASKNNLSGNINISLKAGMLLFNHSLSINKSNIKINNIDISNQSKNCNILPNILNNLISHLILDSTIPLIKKNKLKNKI